MGMPTQPIRDVMRRTMANLEFIESHAGADGPYEVTQLINSFLGALAHPYEAMKPSLMALPTSEAIQRGWPAIAKERATDAEPDSLGDLVRLMRNGFAHGNIEFLSGPKGEIKRCASGTRNLGASAGLGVQSLRWRMRGHSSSASPR